MADRFRVTYATLSAENEDLHAAYEEGLTVARSWCGAALPTYVNGEPRTAGEPFTVVSPGDTSLTVCTVHSATHDDINDAIAAAKAAAPEWAAKPWSARVELLRRAADVISERCNELAGLISLEVGKNASRRSAMSGRPPSYSATTARRWRTTPASPLQWTRSRRTKRPAACCDRTGSGA